MKPSTLSMQDLAILRLHVEADMEYEGSAKTFDFQGMKFNCSVRHGFKERDQAKVWWVGVEFANGSDEEKRCPYVVEAKAAGLFIVDQSIPAEKVEAFVYESGAAIVYGAIREMVATVTGRSAHGVMLLPTASFSGTFQEHTSRLAAGADGNQQESSSN